MTVYNLKEKFQSLLRPLVNNLNAAGFTANQITLFALSISLIWGCAIYYLHDQGWPLYLLPVLLFVRMALNAIDGMLAREHHQQSALGAILNELGDVVADTALYLPFAVIKGLSPELVILIAFLSVFSEMAGIISIQIGASRRYDGPMGKSDRAVGFGLIGVLLGFNLFSTSIINVILFFMALGLILTIFNRCSRALKELHS
jgi:CDP-diacylglycerol--glycerol-3-phosphate 3-phosphatidyltransferase